MEKGRAIMKGERDREVERMKGGREMRKMPPILL